MSTALIAAPGCGDGGTEGTGGSAMNAGGSGGGAGAGSGGNAGSGSGTGAGANGEDPLAGVDPNTQYGACVTYLTKRCQRGAECSGFPEATAYTCAEALDTCPDFLFSEGSNVTIEQALSCAEIWETHPCDPYIVELEAPECSLLPGNLTAGEPCSFHSQCDSRACSTSEGCGMCLPKLELGDPCIQGDTDLGCPNGTFCPSGFCELPTPVEPNVVGLGEDCEEALCQEGLICTSTSEPTPICVARHAPGASCADHPYCALGESCNLEKVCTAGAGLGESCAEIACRDYAWHCSDALVCELDSPAGGSCRPALWDCQGMLFCECADGTATCTTGVCTERRFVGQTCSGPGQRCLGSGVCEGGVCVDPGTLIGTFAECPM